MLGSLTCLEEILFFFLKIFTKFSACLTDSFFSIILLATNEAFSNPTRIFACPADIFLSSINFKISDGNDSILNEFVM